MMRSMGNGVSFELQRFVTAQDDGQTYQQALSELRRGRKLSHWMWFVFPQLVGLGRSSISCYYAIASLDEARAYVAHPVLGPRLINCAQLLLDTEGRSAEQIFGGLDAQKLQSSMTLFARAAPDEPIFIAVLDRYFGGTPDPATIGLLAAKR
jgi:uncharacterized protein (DUF1810 family)